MVTRKNIKEKGINQYLIWLFIIPFIIFIILSFFEDYEYKSIVEIALFTILIMVYLIFTEKNNNRFETIFGMLMLYVLHIIFSYISRLVLGFNFKNAFLSMITDFTSLFMIIVFYYIVVKNNLKLKDQEKLLMVFYYFTIVFIVYSLIFQFDQIKLLVYSSNSSTSNVSSFYVNRNGFGHYLFLFYYVFLTQKGFYKYKIGRIRYYFFLVIISCFLIFTLSRTSIASTLILVGLFVISNIYDTIKENRIQKKHILITFTLFLLFAIISSFLLNNPKFVSFVTTKLIRFNRGTSGRREIWKIGIQNLKLNKFFGIGSFESIGTISYNSFHNTIVELLVRSGIIGLTIRISIFISFLIYHFNHNLKNKKQKRYIKFFLFSLFISMQLESFLLFKIEFRSLLTMFVIFVLINNKTEDKENQVYY